MLGSAVNWTEVLVVGVPSYIGAIFAGVAMLVTSLNRRSLRTPSGDSIGAVAERTHDLAAVGAAVATGTNGPAVDAAVRRINADRDSVMTIDLASLKGSGS